MLVTAIHPADVAELQRTTHARVARLSAPPRAAAQR